MDHKEEGKNHIEETNIEVIERFIEDFNGKQKEIEAQFELLETIDQDALFPHFTKLNELIQDLSKFFSNATHFLRIYDKKMCQRTLHNLQMRLKDLENLKLPKKKFGFKSRKNKVNLKVDTKDVKNVVKKPHSFMESENILTEELCGFCKRENEVLILEAGDVEKKHVVLSDLKRSCIKIYGNPCALQIINLQNCQVYCGPVTTSVYVENVNDSALHLACQQLRIHKTTNTEFFIHVTSKAIIEDSENVRFGIYKLEYDGIEEHYKASGLNRIVNNWDKVDDFNWLAMDMPSPNWSKLT